MHEYHQWILKSMFCKLFINKVLVRSKSLNILEICCYVSIRPYMG